MAVSDMATQRRADLARRVNFCQEALRPFLAEATIEGRQARRIAYLLMDVASELVDDSQTEPGLVQRSG